MLHSLCLTIQVFFFLLMQSNFQSRDVKLIHQSGRKLLCTSQFKQNQTKIAKILSQFSVPAQSILKQKKENSHLIDDEVKRNSLDVNCLIYSCMHKELEQFGVVCWKVKMRSFYESRNDFKNAFCKQMKQKNCNFYLIWQRVQPEQMVTKECTRPLQFLCIFVPLTYKMKCNAWKFCLF